MFLDNFVYDLNKLGILMVIFFSFFSIIRIHIISKIINHLKEEFNAFYVELNPNDSIKMFFMSGGSFLFGFKYIFSERYMLDDYLKGKKKLLIFVTFSRVLIFIILIYILFIIKIIVLK
ncbi:MAG: hypothetical protein PF569_04375 [Candidatus Woesearchaeota archaeon]|jgi:hypothetical protein|nr:hypothetical protein [Candidatus Woesearchaeota archaeon]